MFRFYKQNENYTKENVSFGFKKKRETILAPLLNHELI